MDEWVEVWNRAVNKIPHSGIASADESRPLLLRYILKLTAEELREIIRTRKEPDARVMRLIRMMAGEDGKTWIKTWLHDVEGAAHLLWPDGTVVYETFRRET